MTRDTCSSRSEMPTMVTFQSVKVLLSLRDYFTINVETKITVKPVVHLRATLQFCDAMVVF